MITNFDKLNTSEGAIVDQALEDASTVVHSRTMTKALVMLLLDQAGMDLDTQMRIEKALDKEI